MTSDQKGIILVIIGMLLFSVQDALIKNLSSQKLVGTAIPSVAPNSAARFLNKTECFCFNNQPLAAGEDAELAVVFIIDPDLPASVNTVTLSYTIFDITDRVPVQVSQLQ